MERLLRLEQELSNIEYNLVYGKGYTTEERHTMLERRQEINSVLYELKHNFDVRLIKELESMIDFRDSEIVHDMADNIILEALCLAGYKNIAATYKRLKDKSKFHYS
jgi:hypothetical protein